MRGTLSELCQRSRSSVRRRKRALVKRDHWSDMTFGLFHALSIVSLMYKYALHRPSSGSIAYHNTSVRGQDCLRALDLIILRKASSTMWIKECIAVVCLNCSKKWTAVHEWRDEDDDSEKPTIKGWSTKKHIARNVRRKSRERTSRARSR